MLRYLERMQRVVHKVLPMRGFHNQPEYVYHLFR